WSTCEKLDATWLFLLPISEFSRISCMIEIPIIFAQTKQGLLEGIFFLPKRYSHIDISNFLAWNVISSAFDTKTLFDKLITITVNWGLFLSHNMFIDLLVQLNYTIYCIMRTTRIAAFLEKYYPFS
ncbi:hypothetical protein ACJX0J_023196, partial [Zea mays]